MKILVNWVIPTLLYIAACHWMAGFDVSFWPMLGIMLLIQLGALLQEAKLDD